MKKIILTNTFTCKEFSLADKERSWRQSLNTRTQVCKPSNQSPFSRFQDTESSHHPHIFTHLKGMPLACWKAAWCQPNCAFSVAHGTRGHPKGWCLPVTEHLLRRKDEKQDAKMLTVIRCVSLYFFLVLKKCYNEHVLTSRIWKEIC